VRCVRRDVLRRIEPFFTVDGLFFGPEMMVLSILMKRKIIQIPVNYTKRVGTSSVTGNTWVAVRLGLRMIQLILDYRIRSWLAPSRFATQDSLPTLDLVTETWEDDEEKER
jgi:hypothetical protein